MSVGPNINVWTLGKGARGEWKLQLSTADIEEAVALFTKLDGQGRQVALYELGLFEHEGQQVAGQVGFWWSANLNEYMEIEPQGRGVGWADEFDDYVNYTFPPPAQVSAGVPTTVNAAAPTRRHQEEETRERYVEAACDNCGKILPKYELRRFTRDVKTGKTSGTYRTSHSTSSRSSSGSFSNTSRNGNSSTSGRTFYKTETLLLCEECHAGYVKANRTIFDAFIDVLSSSLKFP